MGPDKLMELIDTWPADIILGATELGFMPQLLKSGTAKGIAKECGTDPAPTELLLDALVATGVATKQGIRYSLDEGLKDAFTSDPGGLEPYLMHRVKLRRTWMELADLVRFGQSMSRPWDMEEPDKDDLRAFIGAMATIGGDQARQTLAELEFDGGERILDIGGGPGVYAQEFAKAIEDSKVTILDQPPVCEIAQENLVGSEVEWRISFAPGNALEVEDQVVLGLGGTYDLVLMSNLIHSLSEEEIKQLFRRVMDWTKPGGRIIVKEFFLEPCRTTPARAAIFAINMLVNTPGGRSYTWDEVEEWLEAAAEDADRSFTEPMKRVSLKDESSGMVVGLLT